MVIKRPDTSRTDDSHVQTVIPIHDESPCKAVAPRLIVEPHLEGPSDRVQGIVQALQPLIDAEFGQTLPTGAWLHGLKLADDEAVMTIAPDLACHGHAVASLAFDVMRRLLPDTDIYVGAAPQDETVADA
jgi:hypothetical protein